MMGIRRFMYLFGVLVVGMLLSTASQAEDYSIDLNRLVQRDDTWPVPDYKIERVVRREAEPDGPVPSKKFDVFIKFTEFGSVRLDASGRDGSYDYGLADLTAVKVAWIKNSPNLFIIAWVIEPDARGTAHDYNHGFTILQLSGRRAEALMRGRCSLTAKSRSGVQDGVIDCSRFSFDPKEGILHEQMTRNYESSDTGSYRSRALSRPRKNVDGQVIFVATVNETIALEYKLADGKLQPWKGSLVYHARQYDELGDIARFYLGPYAPKKVLLAVNANLAAKYKDNSPKEAINVDEGAEIRIPVPEKWLLDRFGRTNTELNE
jgi:hypothetical protein